jgi:hypothetical protein
LTENLSQSISLCAYIISFASIEPRDTRPVAP